MIIDKLNSPIQWIAPVGHRFQIESNRINTTVGIQLVIGWLKYYLCVQIAFIHGVNKSIPASNNTHCADHSLLHPFFLERDECKNQQQSPKNRKNEPNDFKRQRNRWAENLQWPIGRLNWRRPFIHSIKKPGFSLTFFFLLLLLFVLSFPSSFSFFFSYAEGGTLSKSSFSQSSSRRSWLDAVETQLPARPSHRGRSWLIPHYNLIFCFKFFFVFVLTREKKR